MRGQQLTAYVLRRQLRDTTRDVSLTAYMFDIADSEPEAQKIANREWVGLGL